MSLGIKDWHNKNRLMFSIIIPLYNKEKTIVRTIKSILAQTVNDYEIIIVDDGSTDSSLKQLRSFVDPRIKIIHQSNSGVSVARNRGIQEAKGGYICFIDADDEWDEDYLETQQRLIKKYKECDVFAVNYRFEDWLGNRYNTIINKLPFINETDGMLTNYFEVASCSHVPVWTSAVIIKRDALLQVKGFPIGVKSGEDLLTWARLALNHKIAYTCVPHATYHLDEGYEYGAEPVRRQDAGDPVGKELRELYLKNRNIIGLRQYLSHWHKMRASVAIRFGEKGETLRECVKALKYKPLNFGVLPFIILLLMPLMIRQKIIAMKKH